MSCYAYRALLFEIGEKLNQHDHKQLLAVCGLKDEADTILDAHSLLERLGKSHFGIDQLADLEEVLKSLEEFPLLEKLEKFKKKRKEYTNLLAKVSGVLDSDERNHLERLKDICKRETSLELGESISNIRTLLKELEKDGSLGFRRLDFLKEILTEIDKEDLVREIEKYEQRRNENDAAEIRKAKMYSWGTTLLQKVKQVDIKTFVRFGGRLLAFPELFRKSRSVGQFFKSVNDWVLPPDAELADINSGSVYFTVQANSLNGLTTLWKMYKDGTLKARLYDFLVTDKDKLLVEDEEELDLQVTISEEEYSRVYIHLNNEAKGHAKVLGREREHSDRTPKEDKTWPRKLKMPEDGVQLLKERTEFQVKQMTTSSEFLGTTTIAMAEEQSTLF